MSGVLHMKLKEHLKKALQPVRLLGQSDKGDVECPAQVFIGDLPPKRQQAGKPDKPLPGRHLPCVVLVPVGGHHVKGSEAVTVALICVVYNPDGRDSEDAESDLAVMISTITGALAPFANGVALDKRFQLQSGPDGMCLPWVKSETQPRPFLQATITSVWTYQGWE